MFENQEKVSFNIASEASYVYILSGQKFIKNAKNDQFGEFLKNLKVAVKQSYQSLLIGQKLVKYAKFLPLDGGWFIRMAKGHSSSSK